MLKKLAVIMIFVLLLVSGCAAQTNLSEDEQARFTEAKTYLQSEFDGMGDMLQEIAETVGTSEANDRQAYAFLNEKLNSEQYFYDIVVCDKDTNILNVATDSDASWIGLNLDSIDRMDELFVAEPVFLLKPLQASDGTPFIYCSVPVENGGWVIAYIDPYSFGANLSSISVGQNIDIGVMDTNANNVYAANMTEIGKNVLTDELYSGFDELQKLVEEKMLPQKQGQGEYTFYASGMGSAIKKQLTWDTVTAFDKELRVYANTEQGVKEDEEATELRDFTEEELGWFDEANSMVEDVFDNMATLTEAAADAYLEYGEDSEEFAKALAEISNQNQIVRNVYYVNAEKYISKAYPAYLAGKSWDTYYQNQFQVTTLTDEPFFTSPITNKDHNASAVVGIGFGFPIVDDGKTVGWIIDMVRVYELASYLTNLQSLGQNVNFMLLNNDGTILYDSDIAEVSKNVLKDELFQGSESLKGFIENELMKNSEGESQYEFYGAGMTDTIQKRIIWKTISFAGNDFKLSMNSEWHASK